MTVWGRAARGLSGVPGAALGPRCSDAAALLTGGQGGGGVSWPGGGIQGRRGPAAPGSAVHSAGGPLSWLSAFRGLGYGAGGSRQGSAAPAPPFGPPDRFSTALPAQQLRGPVVCRVPCLRE